MGTQCGRSHFTLAKHAKGMTKYPIICLWGTQWQPWRLFSPNLQQGSFYAASWLILANFDPHFVIPEISLNQVRKDLACMLGGSGRLFLTVCLAPIYINRAHFSRIFARPEWSLLQAPTPSPDCGSNFPWHQESSTCHLPWRVSLKLQSPSSFFKFRNHQIFRAIVKKDICTKGTYTRLWLKQVMRYCVY